MDFATEPMRRQSSSMYQQRWLKRCRACDTQFLRTTKLHNSITAGRRPARITVANARQRMQNSLIAKKVIAAATAQRPPRNPS